MENNVPHSCSLGPGSICESSHFVLAVWVTLAAAAALLGPAGAISPEEEAELTELCDLNPQGSQYAGGECIIYGTNEPCRAYANSKGNVKAGPQFAMICDMLANGEDICNTFRILNGVYVNGVLNGICDSHNFCSTSCDDGRLMTL